MVKDARLVYQVDSFVLGQRIVQPAYIFTLAAAVHGKERAEPVPLEFMTHPIPATKFAPVVTIPQASAAAIEIQQGSVLNLSCTVRGGTRPYTYRWESNIDGPLGGEPNLKTGRLSIAHRDRTIVSHTIQVTVTDARGMQDTHRVRIRVLPKGEISASTNGSAPVPKVHDPYVGVEWCNLYHGTPGLADISGTAESAQGFKNGIKSLPGWSSRFDWGNDAAWEDDFETASAPGGGYDSFWADNVHFAFFAGHGSSGAFYFGSTMDEHQMSAQDARWGDGLLNWIALHACQTMQNNFVWTVWCDAFKGLHEMFGFHTNTEGSTPPLGSRFAYWASMPTAPGADAVDLRTAWSLACSECFDASVQYAVIYANQAGTDTHNDHLPGFGHVSADPAAPNCWCYYKGTC